MMEIQIMEMVAIVIVNWNQVGNAKEGVQLQKMYVPY